MLSCLVLAVLLGPTNTGTNIGGSIEDQRLVTGVVCVVVGTHQGVKSYDTRRTPPSSVTVTQGWRDTSSSPSTGTYLTS